MFPRNPYKVPESISTEEEFYEWLDIELEKWGEETSTYEEVQLLAASYEFCKDPKNRFFKKETIERFKNKYVTALMNNGWFMKQGNLELRNNAHMYFKHALQVIPQNPLANYRLGYLTRHRQLGDSIGYFAKALELSKEGMETPEFLQLNSSQITNARGMSLGLLSELNALFYDPFEFVFELPQVEALRHYINATLESQVVYFRYDGVPSQAETISINNYDELLDGIRRDPNVLVIDRFNTRPYIRYLGNYMYPENSDKKIKYLLQALRLEPAEDLLIKPNTYSQSATRLNQDLRYIGVPEDELKIASTSNPSGIYAKSSLTVYYFKNPLQ